MFLCSLKVKNMSAKFGTPGKWPWISPASVTGSAWETAVFHRSELLWHSLVLQGEFCSRGPDGDISAWHYSPHFWHGPGAASEPWKLRASELLSWEPPRVRKVGRARTCCAVRVVLSTASLAPLGLYENFSQWESLRPGTKSPQSSVTARTAYPLNKDFRNYS